MILYLFNYLEDVKVKKPRRETWTDVVILPLITGLGRDTNENTPLFFVTLTGAGS